MRFFGLGVLCLLIGVTITETSQGFGRRGGLLGRGRRTYCPEMNPFVPPDGMKPKVLLDVLCPPNSCVVKNPPNDGFHVCVSYPGTVWGVLIDNSNKVYPQSSSSIIGSTQITDIFFAGCANTDYTLRVGNIDESDYQTQDRYITLDASMGITCDCSIGMKPTPSPPEAYLKKTNVIPVWPDTLTTMMSIPGKTTIVGIQIAPPIYGIAIQLNDKNAIEKVIVGTKKMNGALKGFKIDFTDLDTSKSYLLIIQTADGSGLAAKRYSVKKR
jgi:hypothetical protein